MSPDATAELGHPEAAAWVLGALDLGEAAAIQTHLRSCGGCRKAVADFEQVTRALAHPPPELEPPPDLQARTLARVQRAAMSAGRSAGNPQPAPAPAKASRRWRWHWHWHWNFPVFSVAAALGAAAAALVIVLVQTLQTAPAQAEAVIPLRAASASVGSGHATVVHTDNGWSIKLTVAHLPPLGPGQFYECWYAGPANRAGHPELITAGTFIVGHSGTGSFTMWSAANPQVFKTMQITAEQAGDAGQHGRVILTGTARAS